MKVTLIGATEFAIPLRIEGTQMHERLVTDPRAENWDADVIAEVAGRLCYDSYHLPSEKTHDNKGYLANIIKQRHFSVLEHASATFLVEGVSRSLLMEFRTHRHASFSARSTRYVDESTSTYIIPPALRPYLDGPPGAESDFTIADELEEISSHGRDAYQLLYEFLVDKGLPRKEAREAAREVLPGMTETEFIVTANHGAWREILRKRLAPGAAKEIRELSREILDQLKGIAPHTFQDMTAEV